MKYTSGEGWRDYDDRDIIPTLWSNGWKYQTRCYSENRWKVFDFWYKKGYKVVFVSAGTSFFEELDLVDIYLKRRRQ
jgi:hypothetical protein